MVSMGALSHAAGGVVVVCMLGGWVYIEVCKVIKQKREGVFPPGQHTAHDPAGQTDHVNIDVNKSKKCHTYFIYVFFKLLIIFCVDYKII